MKVTLDDFGISKRANKEIYNWTQSKRVDYISLIPNSRYTKDAIQLYKRNKNRKYEMGLHFNLIEGKPLCNKKEIASLVNRKGYFYSPPIFIIRLFTGLIRKEDIMKELQKQYDVLVKNNINCSHINSHQNIHAFHLINSCLVEFAAINKIKYIRQIPTIKNRLRRFPIKYFAFNILYFASSVLFPKHTYKKSSFYETTFHPGTTYD